MNIGVVGIGYVGLVTAVCFADVGNKVFCVDKDAEKIDKLKNGESPIYEPGIEDLIINNIEKERLFFDTELKNIINDIDILFIAVGTPQNEDGSVNLDFVFDVAGEIAESITKKIIIVNKSTSPVGTCEKIEHIISQETPVPFSIVSNPEFLREGSAVKDFFEPERVIVGYKNFEDFEVFQDIYSAFCGFDKIIGMDIKSSEMTKYASNCMLTARISFMNEIANICEATGANINDVKKGIGSDSRIGDKFLNAGIGYGGSCFPKDVNGLISMSMENGHRPYMMESINIVNDNQYKFFASRVYEFFDYSFKDINIAIWGLSFKPGTDDMRDAPSIKIIEDFCRLGAKIKAHDPVAIDNAKKIIGDKIEYTEKYEAIIGADALLILTEWPEYEAVDFIRMAYVMKGHNIFDGRNLYKDMNLKGLGFNHFQVGVPN